MIRIDKIELPLPGWEELRKEARIEGYKFIETLAVEWSTAANRFDAAGETLLGVIDQGMLAAVGGLNCDPFAADPKIGRLRRIYVRPGWRRRKLGEALVAALVDRARDHFNTVRLRAENAGAARLYERLGFAPIENPDATHILHLSKTRLRA